MNLKQILDQTHLPVAYNHFTETDRTPIPELPYITYLESESDNFMADNTIYKNVNDYTIEFYSSKKDITTEHLLEEILLVNKLPFNSSETIWIDDEKMFVKYYYVRMI
ncbi:MULTISPECIES: hypothetical protein [Listeria]|uniref:hypothetical protein n=1 Tax=Listeria TaxID=1637 RepID=UPI000B5901C8|nr:MULTISPECIES: hypothetical protein [Listeria]